MARLQAGTIVSATVEQAIENCLVVCVKHKSKVFRGVLFDEKNAVVSRTSLHGQTSCLQAKEKSGEGNNTGNGGPRSSTRQASLFYKRQNSFACRKVPGSSSGITVFTDADFNVERDLGSLSMGEQAGKGTSVSGGTKTRQVQVKKAKEILKKKPKSVNQVDVTGVNLKRSSTQNQDICTRPIKIKSKASQRVSEVAAKTIHKTGNKKKVLATCKNTDKTEFVKGSVKSAEAQSVRKENTLCRSQYEILTKPCSVPVVPVDTTDSTLQSRTGAMMVFKTLVSSAGTQTNRSLPIINLSSVKNVVIHKMNRDSCSKLVMEKAENMCKTEVPVAEGSEGNPDNTSGQAVSMEVTQVSDISSECDSLNNIQTSEFTTPAMREFMEKSVDLSSTVHHKDIETSIRMNAEFDGIAPTKDKQDNAACELKQEGVTIKRSARLSEKKARKIGQVHLVETKKSEFENSQEASNKLTQVDHSNKDPQKGSSRVIGSDLSNILLSSEKIDSNESKGSVPTQTSAALKRNSGAVTKYTQRMSWVLKPQIATSQKVSPVSVGDIVWGKVHGHPWWPGKVLAVGGIRNSDSDNPWDRDAHVSWFGSSTSSIMHLHALQLFQPNFSKRHKRQKKGCYRLAVRQAQEAVTAQTG